MCDCLLWLFSCSLLGRSLRIDPIRFQFGTQPGWQLYLRRMVVFHHPYCDQFIISNQNSTLGSRRMVVILLWPQVIIMGELSKYSSERLMLANEVQLRSILQQFKQQQLPLWKFGLFVGYNAVSLAGMYFYGVRLRGKRAQPSLQHNNKFTVANLFRKGLTHSLVMIAAYAAGLAFVCSNTISLATLRKLTEIQSTYHSFGLKFDPNYQEHLLFSRMRKFDISEALITEIKAELQLERQRLISVSGLLPDTIKKIEQAQQLFKVRDSELR